MSDAEVRDAVHRLGRQFTELTAAVANLAVAVNTQSALAAQFMAYLRDRDAEQHGGNDSGELPGVDYGGGLQRAEAQAAAMLIADVERINAVAGRPAGEP